MIPDLALSTLCWALLVLAGLGCLGCSPAESRDPDRIPVTFLGGHETDPGDNGRPVRLIAGALGVPPEVFREAFSRVHPAPAFSIPGSGRVHDNKAELMQALGPHGITNDRLDEVSDYYRYNRSLGQMWRNDPAEAYAIIENGIVKRVEVTDGGHGYNSLPAATVPGFEHVLLKVDMAFGREFKNNGSVTAITIPDNPK